MATAIHKTSKLAITSSKVIDKVDAPPPHHHPTVGLPKLQTRIRDAALCGNYIGERMLLLDKSLKVINSLNSGPVFDRGL